MTDGLALGCRCCAKGCHRAQRRPAARRNAPCFRGFQNLHTCTRRGFLVIGKALLISSNCGSDNESHILAIPGLASSVLAGTGFCEAIRKAPLRRCGGGGPLGWGPGGDLLSHGGPHYHRRGAVSLPRSGWDRVVPARHGRQAILAAPFGAAGLRPGAGAGPAAPSVGAWRGVRPRALFSGRRTLLASLSRPRPPPQAAWALYGQASRAISTGKLHASPRFHTRPINLVVSEGPSGDSGSRGGLILGGASRLDAFSGYPVRT